MLHTAKPAASTFESGFRSAPGHKTGHLADPTRLSRTLGRLRRAEIVAFVLLLLVLAAGIGARMFTALGGQLPV